MDDDMNYMDSAMAYGFGPYPGARRRSGIGSRFDPSEEFYSLPLEESVGLYEEVNKKVWLIPALSCRAESAGMKATRADAGSAANERGRCGDIMDMQLYVREYCCGRCGLRFDRNVNASISISHMATAMERMGSRARGEGVRPQHEAVIGELGSGKTHCLWDAGVA